MKKILIFVFVCTALVFGLGGSCKKGSTPPPSGEATLVVVISPPAGSVQPPAPQTDFPVSVLITSTMPSQGVQIDVSAKKDDGSGAGPFFTDSKTTSSPTANFNITGTPVSVVCIAEVTVTSKTNANNKWTGSFRYSRKP